MEVLKKLSERTENVDLGLASTDQTFLVFMWTNEKASTIYRCHNFKYYLQHYLI